jgi:oligopeptide transport system substrate-binding protein
VWKNSMIPAYSFVPPGIAGYEPSVADYADMSQIEREDAAKKILTDLGYGPDKPLKLELRFNTSENHQNTAVAVQDMLKPLGVEVSLVNTDTKTHYGHLEQHGDYDVARAGWIADYKDPETFLRLLVTGDGSNYALYSNPEYDGLMSQAANEADPAKRSKLLSQAEAIFVRDTPYIPLLFYSYHNIVSPKLQGFEDNVMDVHPTRFIKKTS